MKLLAFRIQYFRSIVDSNWVNFSDDQITVFVGQNESGKSSILQSLHCALSNANPTVDDIPIINGTTTATPIVSLKIDPKSIAIQHLEDSNYSDVIALLDIYINHKKSQLEPIEITYIWDRSSDGKMIKRLQISDTYLVELVESYHRYCYVKYMEKFHQSDAITTAQINIAPHTTSTNSQNKQIRKFVYKPSTDHWKDVATQFTDYLTKKLMEANWSSENLEYPDSIPGAAQDTIILATNAIARRLPKAILFDEETGRLPAQIDIDHQYKLIGNGAQAAQNFLTIADIDLRAIQLLDKRTRKTILNQANSKISNEFNEFWTQVIGKSRRLDLKCEIDNYDNSHPDKTGRPHLVFWIRDGNNQLYPSQRSQGVRWFISFFLQLKASEKQIGQRIFLLDEPGANLHARAQKDVLKLINTLAKETTEVIYTTHSPEMIEYPKFYRIHAVQRDDDDDDEDSAPTKVINAHHLSAASKDTLFPILNAMGADISATQLIKKENNVLLEEMSAFYYFTAFWKIFKKTKPAHFIPATGVNKIESLAYMFCGWGLDFIVVTDDDKQARDAHNSLRRHMFGDDDILAKEKLIKIQDCHGVEDIFSNEDFAKLVLKNESINIASRNSEFVKSGKYSKPLLALKFYLASESGEIDLHQFSKKTQDMVSNVLNDIESRLS